MSQEKIKVLELLQDGKITTDEALKLLEQLQGDSDPRSNGPRSGMIHPEPPVPPVPPVPPETFHFPGNFVNELTENLADMAESFSNFNFNFDFDNIGFNGGRKQIFTAESQPISQWIKEIKMSGKNGRVELVGWDRDVIAVEAKYIARGNESLDIEFIENDGVYSLLYHEGSVRSMEILVKVPHVTIEKIVAQSKNAPVIAQDMIVKKAILECRNSNIRVEKLTADELIVSNRNAEIQITDTHAKQMDVTNANAKIALDNVVSDTAILQTSNAKIDIRRTSARELTLRTSNASLYIDGFQAAEAEYGNNGGLYELTATTSNGSIQFAMPKDMPCKISAATSNAGIKTDVDDLIYTTHDKRHVEAKTADYDEATRKIRVSLQTSNASIRIEPGI